MNILWVIGSLNPTLGGPVAALTQAAIALRDLGHTSEVLTLDAKDAPGVDEFPCTVHALGPSWGTYRYNTRFVSWLRENAAGYDAVIVRGIWQYHSLGTWLASRKARFPYFVFTHGMLDPWFRYAYPLKHIKKWLYWPWGDYRVLRDASAVLFTCREEKLRASKSFWLYKANEVVVSYGTASPLGDPALQRRLFLAKFPDLVGKKLVLFLARIHQKKGCDMLIEAFAETAKQDPSLHLVMAGPDQAGWQSVLVEKASQLGLDGRITWTGMLNGDIKWGAFHAADVFVLPSHSENFGVAVAEALACGLPVLISDKVNIWREICADRAGIADSDTVAGTRRLLSTWRLLDEVVQKEMRENAERCFLQHFDIRTVSRQFVNTIDALVKNGNHTAARM